MACLNVQIGFGATPLGYGFPGAYSGGASTAGGSSYLGSPGLVYPPPQQPQSSTYSPPSPVDRLPVKLGRSPDSQGGSSAGSSSSGRPPTVAAADSPGPDYQRHHPLTMRPAPDYYPDDVRDVIGMYLPVNSSPAAAVEHQWMNPAAARFVHQYVVTSPPGHVTGNVGDDAARINAAAFTRLV